MVITHTHAKDKVRGHSVQKLEWIRRTDRQTDGRRRLDYLPC